MKSDYFQTADNLSTSSAGCERPLFLWPHTNVLIAARNYVGKRLKEIELIPFLLFLENILLIFSDIFNDIQIS